jgi:hypothetical protein
VTPGSRPPHPEAPTLIDYILVAMLNLGGDAAPVDMEDIAVEAMRMAPQRFRWRKYDYPSLEWVRVTFNDANKHGARMILRSGNRYERMLTAQGADRAREVASRLQTTPPDRTGSGVLRRQATAELARLEGHPAFRRWREDGWGEIDAVDLADVARCTLSATLTEFQTRLLRLEAEAAKWERAELRTFLGESVKRLPELLEAEAQR